jgi:hypothetical protein
LEELAMHGIPHLNSKLSFLVELFQCVFLGVVLEFVKIDVDPGSLDGLLLTEGDVLEVIRLDLFITLQRVVVQVVNAVAEVALLPLQHAQSAYVEPAK